MKSEVLASLQGFDIQIQKAGNLFCNDLFFGNSSLIIFGLCILGRFRTFCKTKNLVLFKVIFSGGRLGVDVGEVQTFFTGQLLTLCFETVRQNCSACLAAGTERELQWYSNHSVWKHILKCLCCVVCLVVCWFLFFGFFLLHVTWLDCTFYQARSNNAWFNQLRAEFEGICRTNKQLSPIGFIWKGASNRCEQILNKV